MSRDSKLRKRAYFAGVLEADGGSSTRHEIAPWLHEEYDRGVREQKEYLEAKASLFWQEYPVSAQSRAVQDVIAERHRQRDGEGFTDARDDAYTQGQLAQAAATYAWAASISDSSRGAMRLVPMPDWLWKMLQSLWPMTWHWNHFKPTTRRRDLVKAAALAIAEIERLDRMGAE